MKRETNVEAVTTINYQFTAIPTNLFYLLDNNTRTLLFCLIQSSSYYAKEDGFFYITKEAIGELTNLSVNVITAAIDTLYINGLVYVQTVGKSKGKYVNHYRVNFEEFKRFEEFTFEDLKNPLNKIEMVKYKNNYQPQYIKDYLSNNEGKQLCKEQRKQERKKVITNIDNIENKDNKNNIYNNNINKKNINIYNNILEENSEEIEVIETSISDNNKGIENYEIEEVGLIENPTSEKEEKEIEDNNNTFQLCEVGMLEEKNDDMIETTKKIFYEYLNNFGNGITNMEELTNRAVKFNGWLERQYQADNITYNEYSSMIEECRDKFTSIQKVIQHQNEEKINELQDEFLKSVLLDSKEAKTVNQIKEEKNVETSSIKTKEELIKNLQVFKDSLTNYDNLEDAKHQLHSYCDKNDKLIREYELTSMVGNILSEIDNIKNANKSVLTDFNSQDIETTNNNEKTQEIASCEVMDDSNNIEDCIASLIEDLEPAVLDKEEILF